MEHNPSEANNYWCQPYKIVVTHFFPNLMIYRFYYTEKKTDKKKWKERIVQKVDPPKMSSIYDIYPYAMHNQKQ
jgi:hypothetical protein